MILLYLRNIKYEQKIPTYLENNNIYVYVLHATSSLSFQIHFIANILHSKRNDKVIAIIYFDYYVPTYLPTVYDSK